MVEVLGGGRGVVVEHRIVAAKGQGSTLSAEREGARNNEQGSSTLSQVGVWDVRGKRMGRSRGQGV